LSRTPHGFGIIGAGVIAHTHARAVAALAAARLVAVTDVAAGAAREFAGRHGCAVEPDLDALLARDDIDVVAVCVPSGLHAEVGARAAAAGRHLVIEKPIDVSRTAADRLITTVRDHGVRATVISQHRFDPGLIELRRLLDAGALGQLVLGEAATKWHRTQGYYDSAQWRGTWALDGGSLMNQGIHYADLLLWTMGPVAEVTAVTTTRAHMVEVEDTALCVIRFSSGALGTLVSSTAVFPGSAQRLEVHGTGGTVVIEDGLVVQRALRGEPGESAGTGPGQAGSAPGEQAAAADPAALGVESHVAQLADLLAAIDEGRDPLITVEDGRATLELICAVYASAREGRTVVLGAS